MMDEGSTVAAPPPDEDRQEPRLFRVENLERGFRSLPDSMVSALRGSRLDPAAGGYMGRGALLQGAPRGM